MQSNKGALALMAFCIILGVVAIAFVVRSDGPANPVRPAISPPDAATARASLETAREVPKESAPAADLAPVPQDAETGDENVKPDPRLVVPPVDEPDMPLDEAAGAKYRYITLPNSGGFVFQRPDAEGKMLGGVVVPGRVLVRAGLVELFGCGEGGKVHETILQLECDLQSLDLALTYAHLKRGKLPEKLDIASPDQGSRVVILVQWNDKDGKLVTHRSEDLVVSVRREKPMPRVGWTYVGNWTDVVDPTSPTLDRRHKVLACTGTKSVITTFRDVTALLDNPLPEAEDDTLFAANYMILPRSGTPVRVIIRVPSTAERDEIARLEKDVLRDRIEFKKDDRAEKDK